MKSFINPIPTVLTCVIFAIDFASGACAQQSIKQKIVGAWTIVSVEIVKDGSHFYPYGTHPTGTIIFDDSGHYAQVLTRPDIPNYAADNRMMGTAEEHKAVAQGVDDHFGTYTIDEIDRSIMFKVGNSSYPNWRGTAQERAITRMAGDELTLSRTTPTVGEYALVVLKRVK